MSAVLPPDVLARRAALPRKPASVTLAGSIVELRPLDLERDVDALHEVSNGSAFVLGDRRVEAYDPDARIWRYMAAGPFATAQELGTWLATQVADPIACPLTVTMRGVPVGVLNLMANEPQHLKIELGRIWYGPIAQRTGASAEATRLAIGHLFALGYRRVEWKCDALNEASRRAALAYGFRFEGIQDAHYIVKDRNRDTAWFRLLASEWRG